MPQQQSPWLETAYGWAYGENGWNAGMDSNLLKFSVMFDRNIDSIVASLPPAVNGQVHYNTTDNRIYFAVNTSYFSTPAPKWFTVVMRSTGVTWQYNGTSLVEVQSVGSLNTRLDAVELTLSSLGSAAFEDVSAFATQAELDVVEAQGQAYTDDLRQDVFLESNLLVLIPTDYPTLQAAIDDLSLLQCKQGVTIELMIETGHLLTSGILVSNGNYSQFKISSVDAEVTLDVTFPFTDIIKGVNAWMPTLNCLIDANSKGDNGYFADAGSKGFVSPGCGVRRCAQQGCYANNGSNIVADGSIFTEASQIAPDSSGILAWASTISAVGADASGSLYYGAQAAAGGVLHFRNGIADGAARHGVRATNAGIVNARGASSKNTGVTAFRAFDTGVIHATDSNATGSLGNAYQAENGGAITADNVTAGAATSALVALGGSRITSSGGVFSSGSVRADDNSHIGLVIPTIANTGGRALSAVQGSTIVCRGGTISGGDADRLINILAGSKVVLSGTSTTTTSSNIAVVDNGSELSIFDGSHSYTSVAINCLDGSILRLHGSGIPASAITGMVNATLVGRGIMWGAS